jgi:hypothetical protein
MSTSSDGTIMLSRLDAIALWLGGMPQCTTIFTGGAQSTQTWANLLTSQPCFTTSLLTSLHERDILPIICIPIATGSQRGVPGFQAVLNNSTTQAQIRAIGQNIKNRGITEVAFRIGHEANLRQVWPWSVDYDRANGYVNYKAAFNKVAEILLDEVPSAFIDWCMFKQSNYGPSNTQYDIDLIYPGGDYITHICLDLYDAAVRTTDTNYTTWKNNGTAARPIGPGRWADYARLKGKRFGIDEWGIVEIQLNDDGAVNIAGGCDNPVFFDHSKRLFDEYSDVLDWFSYFRFDALHPAGDEFAHSLVYFTSVSASNTPQQNRNNLRLKTAMNGAWNGEGSNPGAANGAVVGNASTLATAYSTARYKAVFWP